MWCDWGGYWFPGGFTQVGFYGGMCVSQEIGEGVIRAALVMMDKQCGRFPG